MKPTLWCAIVLALLAAPASAATVSLDPHAAVVQPGDAFAMDVVVADATDLYGFQFDVSFDPAVVQADAVLEGDFLHATGAATLFLPGTIDNTTGTVSFTANTLLGAGRGVTGDGWLVRLWFQALAAGRSELSFSNVVLLDSTLAELDVVSRNGAVEVFAPSRMPEPASAVLVALALVVLGARVRRQVPLASRAKRSRKALNAECHPATG